MPPRSPDAKPLSELFQSRPQQRSDPLDKAQLISEMTLSLRQFSNEPWIRHIRVANLRGDVIVMFSSTATALVALRSRNSKVLQFFNQRFQLSCSQIEAKVRPQPKRAPGV